MLAPRPLPLQMAIQTMTWVSSVVALQPWKNGSLNWKPELSPNASALRKKLQSVDDLAFADALTREAGRRMAAFAEGVMAFHAYPRTPRPAPPPAIWAEGTTRVLDYGTTHTHAAEGVPLLIVPSLVNRAHILDLMDGRSFCRFLAAEGFRPFLVDWDAPGELERDFDLGDYIAGRLQSALDAVVAEAGRAPGIIGYCMGGNLALALAARNPGRIKALGLLATPWDFHADMGAGSEGGTGAKTRLLAASLPQFEVMLQAFGELPVDALQAFFTGLDPYLPTAKFQHFAARAQKGAQADLFVALEDWLNDGVALTAPVARDCIKGWYVQNDPARGHWRVAGAPVIPEEVEVPTLLAIPERDHIVPPASARALLDALPNAEALAVAAGHIGMMAGSRAERGLYRPLARWLRDTL